MRNGGRRLVGRRPTGGSTTDFQQGKVSFREISNVFYKIPVQISIALRKFVLRNVAYTSKDFYNKLHTIRLACNWKPNMLIRNPLRFAFCSSLVRISTSLRCLTTYFSAFY
jgi:hypothetical protein